MEGTEINNKTILVKKALKKTAQYNSNIVEKRTKTLEEISKLITDIKKEQKENLSIIQDKIKKTKKRQKKIKEDSEKELKKLYKNKIRLKLELEFGVHLQPNSKLTQEKNIKTKSEIDNNKKIIEINKEENTKPKIQKDQKDQKEIEKDIKNKNLERKNKISKNKNQENENSNNKQGKNKNTKIKEKKTKPIQEQNTLTEKNQNIEKTLDQKGIVETNSNLKLGQTEKRDSLCGGSSNPRGEQSLSPDPNLEDSTLTLSEDNTNLDSEPESDLDTLSEETSSDESEETESESQSEDENYKFYSKKKKKLDKLEERLKEKYDLEGELEIKTNSQTGYFNSIKCPKCGTWSRSKRKIFCANCSTKQDEIAIKYFTRFNELVDIELGRKKKNY
ncbi:hypothetical protein M0812_24993 [Anaeramoeba flamelloides]|uniref:Uncharacterized protein n=1 Tax=Anaeramoeba flamelloides TaxID=1746091 RepID=A0AAV7YLW4_9EUKA|nr:hypothetical protein M0812_24993 [Anaeramoeba flamelloides]